MAFQKMGMGLCGPGGGDRHCLRAEHYRHGLRHDGGVAVGGRLLPFVPLGGGWWRAEYCWRRSVSCAVVAGDRRWSKFMRDPVVWLALGLVALMRPSFGICGRVAQPSLGRCGTGRVCQAPGCRSWVSTQGVELSAQRSSTRRCWYSGSRSRTWVPSAA